MGKLKGISLPIEMIVIIAIAVLVLVVIAAFFVGGAGKLGSVSDVDALGQGCQQWRTQGCSDSPSSITIKGYDPTGKGSDSDLGTACSRLAYDPNAQWTNQRSCLRACGCPEQEAGP